MYVGEILKADSANGLGIRLTVFVSGCLNHCEGCFQPETWDFDYGQYYDKDMEDGILAELAKPFYRGITFLGGDPMEVANQPNVLGLIQRIQAELPDKDIWLYTGYLFDKDLIPGGRRYTKATDPILSAIDVLVDGPFILDQKDITLHYRGSSNQRVIDMNATRLSGEITLMRF